ncbi:hypothetical protein DMH20_16715 [Escherichia coli]|nr:hypothetical protein [Escherichia coli]NYY77584.1 hypothetical protein [Escherichia coli]
MIQLPAGATQERTQKCWIK